MQKLTIIEEQVASIDLQRNELFKEKDKIDKRLVSLHNKKEKLLQILDKTFINSIPEDVNKINAKQWSWILEAGDGFRSMLHYRYRNNLLSKYKANSFGYYTQTNQACISFYEEGFDVVKAKELFKLIRKHYKPITVNEQPVETGVCFQFTGLASDTTSIAYINDDKTAIIYISNKYDYKKFKGFNELVDWYKQELENKKLQDGCW